MNGNGNSTRILVPGQPQQQQAFALTTLEALSKFADRQASFGMAVGSVLHSLGTEEWARLAEAAGVEMTPMDPGLQSTALILRGLHDKLKSGELKVNGQA